MENLPDFTVVVERFKRPPRNNVFNKEGPDPVEDRLVFTKIDGCWYPCEVDPTWTYDSDEKLFANHPDAEIVARPL